MSKSAKIIIFIAIFIVLVFTGWMFFSASEPDISDQANANTNEEKIEKKDRIEKIEIGELQTYGELMASSSIADLAMEIYTAALPTYDLAKIRAGKTIDIIFDKETDTFKELQYKIDTEDELIVSLNPEMTTSSEKWIAKIQPIPYEVREKISGGVVESSMYQAALDNDIDIRAIIELADAFQWSIDFAMDPRVGDTFKFVYEERYLGGEYVMPGKVMAGYYINDGTRHDVYYFEESEDNIGFFDADGNSVQKLFLKAPVSFRYISSGYTTGKRIVMEVGLYGSHMAIDYAAALGTPIRAVGDGTVIFAGRSGCYGNLTKIRHNGTYSTNYAHQSKFAVRVGQKVKQGDVIGYVGSTGCSTGPHLHFEMMKNGVKIDPLEEVLPPGKPIRDENRARFEEQISQWKEKLK